MRQSNPPHDTSRAVSPDLRVKADPSPKGSASLSSEEQLLRLVLDAYPDRVCRRRASDPQAAAIVGGGGVRLGRESVVKTGEFFIAADARHDPRSYTKEAVVRVASLIELDWLEQMFPTSIRRERGAVYDEEKRRVVGRLAVWYRDLLVREEKNVAVDSDVASRVLAEALVPRVNDIFAANESAAAILARLDLLRRAMPEHPWPVFDESEWLDVLREACAGKRSAAEVESAPLGSLLLNRLPYPLDRLLAEHAPEAIAVPTGNRIKLSYSTNSAPVLAVRLQEMFGQVDTPRGAGGRVPVLLHLLGPNYRPVQITSDLKNFWATTYVQVRKDLRVRYPKHSWPEDPLTAPPQAKGRPRQ
jgi:ATP-dependent helicase HrpB